jgi:hypothetical protein
MNFDQFRNRVRLYVLGALDGAEMKEIERAAGEFGQKAEDFIQECYALREAFALRLRPANSLAAQKERLMAMVRERQGH